MVHTTNQQTHFVLVHEAWCWFKLKPLLEASGHRVSTFDLAASGTNTQAIQDVATLSYNADQTDSEISMFFGPKFLSSKLYQLSSTEDLELGKTLIRPSSLFMKDLRNAEPFTKGGFGSVRRPYVICDEDNSIKKEFQQWMTDNNPVDEVKELKHVDHMPMLCDPKQLSVCLLVEIAVQYAYLTKCLN